MSDLQKSIRKAMDKGSDTPTFDGTKTTQASPSSPERVRSEKDLIRQEPEGGSAGENFEKRDKKKRDKPLKNFGWLCVALFFIALKFIPSSTPDTSEAAKNALKDKVSTSLAAGTILLAEDENIGQQDYTITHQYGQSDTKIWVWDYAAEDGDYVQVLVNGTPMADAFMIKHKPVEIMVPAVGDVQVKGIRDGGGGITYAIRYDLNGTNYFNSAPGGEFNTYTLFKE